MEIAKPDIVLFVGDIAEGSIRTIKIINKIKIPCYVILGNHDRGKDKSGETLLKQIRLLGEKYCGWNLKIFNDALNIVGCRPCSSGGGYYLSKEVIGVYGPLSEIESSKKIIDFAHKAKGDLPLLMLAHSGPVGLGSESNSICGKDWKYPPSDWGDRDLAYAISKIQKNRFIDIVVFGHMHNKLSRNLGYRDMFKIDGKGTAYLNAAIVPRYKLNSGGKELVNFSWIEFKNRKLSLVSQRWYSIFGELEKQSFLYENKL